MKRKYENEIAELDEYTIGYFRSKRQFQNLLKSQEEMRQEQFQYIVNSLKLTLIFLHLDEQLGLDRIASIKDKIT
jgi:hypothetical protein